MHAESVRGSDCLRRVSEAAACPRAAPLPETTAVVGNEACRLLLVRLVVIGASRRGDPVDRIIAQQGRVREANSGVLRQVQGRALGTRRPLVDLCDFGGPAGGAAAVALPALVGAVE
eukprot:5019297-Alexandrium_andersonii.AAC.1